MIWQERSIVVDFIDRHKHSAVDDLSQVVRLPVFRGHREEKTEIVVISVHEGDKEAHTKKRIYNYTRHLE